MNIKSQKKVITKWRYAIVKRRCAIAIAIISLLLPSCNNVNNTPQPSANSNNQQNQKGETLILTANGEDFIRKGFVSKDGWKINFNHVYVTLNEVIAYQTSTPFNAETDTNLKYIELVNLINTPTTVDLAEGDENAPPIVVTQVPAKQGFYNAISWKVVNNQDKSSIILDGIAEKNGEIINFVLNLPQELSYVCGEFVGENRKGIVTKNQSADVEITFHFDHVFGDEKTPADSELNIYALGFEPLKNLANKGELKTNLENLQKKLTAENYQKLENSLLSLGHVGEGHCHNN
jgi:hypothetical protein